MKKVNLIIYSFLCIIFSIINCSCIRTKQIALNDRSNILFNCENDSLYFISNIYIDDRFYIIEAIHDKKTYKILSDKPIIKLLNDKKKEIEVNNCYPLKLDRLFPPKNIPFTEAVNIKSPIKGEKEVYKALNLYGLFILLDN